MGPGHRAFVESWLRRRSGIPADLLAAQALEVVWARARRSLSELSLQALGRCALEAAAREFPALAGARVSAAGFQLPVSSAAGGDEALAALGGLLVEFLALVEATSGGILAPALEAELLGVSGGRRGTVGAAAG
jgi:hypothetical protein